MYLSKNAPYKYLRMLFMILLSQIIFSKNMFLLFVFNILSKLRNQFIDSFEMQDCVSQCHVLRFHFFPFEIETIQVRCRTMKIPFYIITLFLDDVNFITGGDRWFFKVFHAWTEIYLISKDLSNKIIFDPKKCVYSMKRYYTSIK